MTELFCDGGPFHTGIREIDQEHAHLHVSAKELSALVKAHEGEGLVRECGMAFIEQCKSHFDHEQQMLGEIGLERGRVGAHIDDHTALLTHLKELFDTYLGNRTSEMWENFIGFEDLLIKHIIMFDLDIRHIHWSLRQ